MAPGLQERATAYERLGGRAVLQRIADRFYDLMERDPAYAELRAMHADDLAPMRHSLAGFLGAWCGGPRDWFDENPGKCFMSVHGSQAIDELTAGQWMAAMRAAVAEVAPEDRETRELFIEGLDRIAQAMTRGG